MHRHIPPPKKAQKQGEVPPPILSPIPSPKFHELEGAVGDSKWSNSELFSMYICCHKVWISLPLIIFHFQNVINGDSYTGRNHGIWVVLSYISLLHADWMTLSSELLLAVKLINPTAGETFFCHSLDDLCLSSIILNWIDAIIDQDTHNYIIFKDIAFPKHNTTPFLLNIVDIFN